MHCQAPPKQLGYLYPITTTVLVNSWGNSAPVPPSRPPVSFTSRKTRQATRWSVNFLVISQSRRQSSSMPVWRLPSPSSTTISTSPGAALAFIAQVGVGEASVSDHHSALPFSKWPALDQSLWNAAFANTDLFDCLVLLHSLASGRTVAALGEICRCAFAGDTSNNTNVAGATLAANLARAASVSWRSSSQTPVHLPSF